MRTAADSGRQAGVVLVELVICLSVVVFVVFATISYAYRFQRRAILAAAARSAGREAVRIWYADPYPPQQVADNQNALLNHVAIPTRDAALQYLAAVGAETSDYEIKIVGDTDSSPGLLQVRIRQCRTGAAWSPMLGAAAPPCAAMTFQLASGLEFNNGSKWKYRGIDLQASYDAAGTDLCEQDDASMNCG